MINQRNMVVKIFIGFCVAIASWSNCTGQARVFFFAGPQASTAKYSIRNTTQSTTFKYGFRAGTGMKVDFDEHLYFSPALSFSRTGYKVKFDRPASPPDSSAKDNNTSISQADLDLHLQYDFGSQPKHFFINAGPTFNFLLSGRETFQPTGGEAVSRKMKLGLYSAYGRFLVAFVTAVGYEASSGFFVNLQYSNGLISMNNADDGPQIFQRVIGLNAGMLLHANGK